MLARRRRPISSRTRTFGAPCVFPASGYICERFFFFRVYVCVVVVVVVARIGCYSATGACPLFSRPLLLLLLDCCLASLLLHFLNVCDAITANNQGNHSSPLSVRHTSPLFSLSLPSSFFFFFFFWSCACRRLFGTLASCGKLSFLCFPPPPSGCVPRCAECLRC